MSPLPFAAIEAGGTKCLLAIGHHPDQWLEQHRLPTGASEPTLARLRDLLGEAIKTHGGLRAVGVAAFGPLQLDPSAPDFAHVLATPKPEWQGTDWRGVLPHSQLPFAIDTDVNAAALAEQRWGAGRNTDCAVYLTVGTGIGGGIVIRGQPVHGVLHPEIGHLHVQRHADDVHFRSICRFHADCVEGLASGPAILARHGQALSAMSPDSSAIDIIADYLGQLCAQLLLSLSAHRIVIGGGVLQTEGLLSRVRYHCAQRINGYLPDCDVDALQTRIVVPHFADSGLVGAFALAVAQGFDPGHQVDMVSNNSQL